MVWTRRFPRLRKEFQIAYKLLDQEKFYNDPISTLALNISGGGICFETTDRLEKGALVSLDIRSDDFTMPILALVKVVWCRRSDTIGTPCARQGDRYKVGAEFWWVGWADNHAQAAIANFVTTHLTSFDMSGLDEQGMSMTHRP